MQKLSENKVEVLGRLIPDSGKIHQNQEVYNSFGGRAMCTLKAVHYKDPPKVLVGYGTKKNEQDNPVRKFEKEKSEV